MLIDFLKLLSDPRDPQGREFKLWEVLLVSILAILSGAKGYTDIARFAQFRLPYLKEHFGITWKRVPHFSAIRKVIIRVDRDELEELLRKFGSSLSQPLTHGLRALSFDGKLLRGSFSYVKDKQACGFFQVLSLADQIVLATVPLDNKESEIPVFQKLITELDLKGVYLTADALHCQKKLLSVLKKQALIW